MRSVDLSQVCRDRKSSVIPWLLVARLVLGAFRIAFFNPSDTIHFGSFLFSCPLALELPRCSASLVPRSASSNGALTSTAHISSSLL